MYNELLNLPLGGGPEHNLLVDGSLGDQPVDHDRLRLPDPVATVLGLQKSVGITARKGYFICRIPDNN